MASLRKIWRVGIMTIYKTKLELRMPILMNQGGEEIEMKRAIVAMCFSTEELSAAIWEKFQSYVPKEFSYEVYLHGSMLRIPLVAESKELNEALNMWKSSGYEPTIFNRVHYTYREIENTKFFQMIEQSPLELEGTSAADYGTCYNGRCPRCRRGGTRVGNILVDRKFMKNKKFGTLVPDWFVSEEIKQVIEENQLTGISFGELVKDYKGRDMEPYYSVCINSVLPPLSKETWLIPYGDICNVCGRETIYLRSDLHYESEKLVNAKDFNITMEYMDNYDIPSIVISANARKAFLKARIRPYHHVIPVTLL